MSVGRPRAALFCFWQLPLCFCEICPVGLACACKWRTECDGSAIAVNYLMSMAAAGEERALCRMASPFQSARALTQIPLTDRDSGRKNFSNGTKKEGAFASSFLAVGGSYFINSASSSLMRFFAVLISILQNALISSELLMLTLL